MAYCKKKKKKKIVGDIIIIYTKKFVEQASKTFLRGVVAILAHTARHEAEERTPPASPLVNYRRLKKRIVVEKAKMERREKKALFFLYTYAKKNSLVHPATGGVLQRGYITYAWDWRCGGRLHGCRIPTAKRSGRRNCMYVLVSIVFDYLIHTLEKHNMTSTRASQRLRRGGKKTYMLFE